MTTTPTRLPIAGGRDTWRAVRRLVGAHRGLTIVAAVTVLLSTVATLIAPRLFGRIIDIVTEGGPRSSLDDTVLALAGAGIAAGLLRAASIALITRLTETTLAQLRCDVVERALGLPLDELERSGTGDLVSRVGNDVAAVSEAARQGFPLFLVSALTVVMTVVAMAAIDWRLGLAALAAAPVQASALRNYLPRSRPVYAEERAAEGDQTQHQLAAIGANATVRDLGRSDVFVAAAADHAGRLREIAVRLNLMQTRFFGRLNVAEMVGTTSVLVVGFLLVRDDAITIGAATAGALYFIGLFDPINALLFLVDEIQSATSSLARLVGISQLPPPVASASPRRPDDASVELRRVGFGYAADHPVLRDIDLAVAPGERVAIVGSSGAGKSTLAKLVADVHEPDSGEVRIGGVPTADIDDRHVVLVSQEVHVFGGPLAEDLRLADPDATDEQLLAALAVVGATEWVDRLPDGLRTVIGEGGHEVSVTHAQQLALARLVLADPPIAVLDEATAEAGSAGAQTLERAAEGALAGRTGIVIAHRLTQAASADRVVVMEHGRVVESGRPDDLVAGEGPYARLWAAWRGAR